MKQFQYGSWYCRILLGTLLLISAGIAPPAGNTLSGRLFISHHFSSVNLNSLSDCRFLKPIDPRDVVATFNPNRAAYFVLRLIRYLVDKGQEHLPPLFGFHNIHFAGTLCKGLSVTIGDTILTAL